MLAFKLGFDLNKRNFEMVCVKSEQNKTSSLVALFFPKKNFSKELEWYEYKYSSVYANEMH